MFYSLQSHSGFTLCNSVCVLRFALCNPVRVSIFAIPIVCHSLPSHSCFIFCNPNRVLIFALSFVSHHFLSHLCFALCNPSCTLCNPICVSLFTILLAIPFVFRSLQSYSYFTLAIPFVFHSVSSIRYIRGVAHGTVRPLCIGL